MHFFAKLYFLHQNLCMDLCRYFMKIYLLGFYFLELRFFLELFMEFYSLDLLLFEIYFFDQISQILFFYYPILNLSGILIVVNSFPREPIFFFVHQAAFNNLDHFFLYFKVSQQFFDLLFIYLFIYPVFRNNLFNSMDCFYEPTRNSKSIHPKA